MDRSAIFAPMSWLAPRASRLLPALLTVLAPMVLVACSDAPEPSPPREGQDSADTRAPRIVLLVSIDTLRADHLGVYGYERFTSPVIDALASQGVVFEDASSTSPWTLPSHASLLTGRTPLQHGATTFGTRLADGVPTLARLLGQAGYRTAAAVSVHWLKPEKYQVTRDFDEVFAIDVPAARRSPSTLVTDRAIEWLDSSQGAPLFLFIHYYDVHSDYKSTPAFEKLFVEPYEGEIDGSGWQLVLANLTDERLKLCREAFQKRLCTLDNGKPPRMIGPTTERLVLDPPAIRHLIQRYDAGIRQMDSELGRLLGHLDDAGLAEETLVVLTSDHGEAFFEHGFFEHLVSPHQEVLHVPLIIRGRGVPAGSRIATPVSLVDVVPTVLALTGVAPGVALEGRSLAPLWQGQDASDFEQRTLYGEASGGLYFEQHHPGLIHLLRSVREGRYKLVHDVTRGETFLYDLAVDPGETQDLSEQLPELHAHFVDLLAARHGDRVRESPLENRVILSEEEEGDLRALGYLP